MASFVAFATVMCAATTIRSVSSISNSDRADTGTPSARASISGTPLPDRRKNMYTVGCAARTRTAPGSGANSTAGAAAHPARADRQRRRGGGQSDHRSRRIETICPRAGFQETPRPASRDAAAIPAGELDGPASQLIELAAFAVANPWQAQKGRQETEQFWFVAATPAGFESVRDLTRPHVECTNARQDEGLEDAMAGHGGPICNDCNEVTPRLARVAKNALLNGDFPRAIEILDRLSRGQVAEACGAAS